MKAPSSPSDQKQKLDAKLGQPMSSYMFGCGNETRTRKRDPYMNVSTNSNCCAFQSLDKKRKLTVGNFLFLLLNNSFVAWKCMTIFSPKIRMKAKKLKISHLKPLHTQTPIPVGKYAPTFLWVCPRTSLFPVLPLQTWTTFVHFHWLLLNWNDLSNPKLTLII